MCREFLLPEQQDAFLKTGVLPERVGKCLLCSRYYTTYIYRMARLDPTFKPSSRIQIQAYGNVVCEGLGSNAVTASSPVGTEDGYNASAMLFVDEQWADTQAARGDMSFLLWRPCVKYCSSHYKFVIDENGSPRVLQVGVSSKEPLFRPPTQAEAVLGPA